MKADISVWQEHIYSGWKNGEKLINNASNIIELIDEYIKESHDVIESLEKEIELKDNEIFELNYVIEEKNKLIEELSLNQKE